MAKYLQLPVKAKVKTDAGFETTLHTVRILLAQSGDVKILDDGQFRKVLEIKRSGSEEAPTFLVTLED